MTLSGCYSVSSYEGSGKLTDYGRQYLVGRYLLDLGTIDLADSKIHSFEAHHLPVRSFIMGLEIEVEDVEECTEPTSNSLISLQIIDENGNAVINIKKLPLNQFTWSHASACGRTMFGYVRGRGHIETKLPNGNVRNRPIYTGVDKGRGTYFEPRTEGTYYITMKVDPVESETSVARLIIKGNSRGN